MSKATGIKGYTPDRLRRAQDAEKRQQVFAARTLDQHLAELDRRPGDSARERKRLERAQ